MKKHILFAATTLLLATALQIPVSAVTLENEASKEERQEEKEARAKAREQKQAEYERFVDSLVIAKTFAFIPSTFEMEPAGRPRNISNPTFRMDFLYKGDVDICLPYFKGITPPYMITVLNYTITPRGYIAVQTDHGWNIKFTSSLYSSNTYTFEMTIYKKTGEVNLDISTDLYNTVTYTGSIIAN